MALNSGMRLGPYQIQSPLGAGGMGEVYKARDTRLGRVVAIKVLRGHLAADSQVRERFEREAKAVSRLSHPHICALYDVGSQDGIDFLVMEYLEGETLADRIARGVLPLDETVHIARQIAHALEAAHDSGIVHRDLKPENIKLAPGGNVKVLDFGLAKAHAMVDGSLDPSDSPTTMATTPGMILGTPAYMSPEQARGAEIDRTADMWAFGCVLFEMLTGRRAFEGATTTEILANVLTTQPDWQRLPVETPPGIRRLLRRSLQKDQKLRLRDMRDARLEMDDVQDAPSQDARALSVRSGRRERLLWASALTLALAIAGGLAVRALRPAAETPERRLEINTLPTRNASLAISPDGLKIVFVATSEGRSRLWLRSLDSSLARPLAGTEGGSVLFWSPDSRSIGFFAGSKLKRMDIDGGSLRTLAAAAVPFGGTWGRDGTILFGFSPGDPIMRMSAQGGEPTAATGIVSAQHRGHGFPAFLPDGRHFLFFANGSPETRGVYIGQLGGQSSTRLLNADGAAVYAATGHLLFIREGQLLAQGFDLDRAELRGEPFPIAANVSAGTTVSASAAGPIVYRTPPADSGQRQLVWVDRSGRETDKVVYADTAVLGPSLSPDGRHIAVYREANGNMDIWSYETRRRAWNRITTDLGDDIWPLWSRDGDTIVFGGARATHGAVDLYRKLLSGPKDTEELLLSTPQPKFPMDWSPDGRFLLYDALDPKQGTDMWALPLGGKPFEVVRTEFNEGLQQFSPDGRWIAYQSDKTGRSEIYLRPFPGPGSELRASIDGGSQARWNPKGEELFYIGADDRLMAVPIRSSSNGKALELGVARGLFGTNVGSTARLPYRQQYVVSADGQSFVMNSDVAVGSASPITVILNWRPNGHR